MVHPFVLRRDAAQALVDRFNGRAFAWGSLDCGVLAAADLKALGHPVSALPHGRYGTERGALKVLKAAGHDGLESVLDRFGLPRIPPAAAIPADLVGLPGEGGWIGLSVALGNGRVLGFQGGACGILQPTREGLAQAIAWRCDPCPSC